LARRADDVHTVIVRIGYIPNHKQNWRRNVITSKVTTNHDEIREWVEARGGQPARVKGTNENGRPGILRVDYPGYSGEETGEQITSQEFFRGFEENRLAFLYQDETKAGEESRFSKLIDHDTAESGRAAHITSPR
jgi:hypothetical protein